MVLLIVNDTLNAHLHFEVLLNGESIGLAGLAEDVWHMGVSASDRENFSEPVIWNQSLARNTQQGFWEVPGKNIVFFRDHTISDDGSTDFFVAYVPGQEIDVVNNRVVWRADKQAWVQVSNSNQYWNGSDFLPLPS